MVFEACITIPKLHIPEEASMEANIKKLPVGVCDAKTEMAKVQFQLNLKFIELELKSQPSNPPEIREQCDAVVKDAVTTVDVAVAYCTMLFQQSMEVITNL